MADFEIIQILLSEPSEKVRSLLHKTKRLTENYKLITDWTSEYKEFYDQIPSGEKWHWLRSDVIRFEYLSQHENVLYLDWDVKVNWLPELNGVTWTSQNDYWAIYNGKEVDKFKYIIDAGINRRRKKITRNWLLPFIEEIGGSVFPKECMEHLGHKNV